MPREPLRSEPGRSLGLAALFLVALVLWMGCASGIGLLVTFGIRAAQGVELQPTDPLALGLGGLLQFLGIIALSYGAARLLQPHASAALAIRKSPGWVWVAATLGSFTVGVFPGWLAQRMLETFPEWDPGALEAIPVVLEQAGPLELGLLILVIGVVGPAAEEIAFRGFLWRAFARIMPLWGVWLVTSVLFAAIHISPVHVVAVFFTGLFLGWMRWMGASIWPCILAHVINNLLAMAVAFAYGPLEATPELGLGGPLLAAGVTIALGAVAWLGRERTP